MKFIIDIPELFQNMSGIYKIENNINDQIYIGRAKNLKNRAEDHKENYKYRNCNSKVNKFIEDYPNAIFKLSVVLFTDNIKEEEERIIRKYNAVEEGFNILHNDEEFLQHKIKYVRKKKKRKIPSYKKHSEQELELLKRGYLRKDDKLEYSPIIARQIINQILEIKNSNKENIKIPKRRDRNWKPMDFSDLCRRCI